MPKARNREGSACVTCEGKLENKIFSRNCTIQRIIVVCEVRNIIGPLNLVTVYLLNSFFFFSLRTMNKL